MARRDVLIVEGTLPRSLGHSLFEATLENGIRIKAKQSHHAYKRRLIVGDRVRVKISPYDTSTGIIA